MLRAAGIAAAAAQRWVEAEQQFETALRQAAELPTGWRRPLPGGGTAGCCWTEALSGTGSGGHLLQAAMADYERMGMPRHRDLAATLLAPR